MNNKGERLKKLETIILKHCSNTNRDPNVLAIHAQAIVFNFEKHEETIGRFSQQKRMQELRDHLNEATKKMAAISQEAASLIGRYIDQAEPKLKPDDQNGQDETQLKVRVERFKADKNGPKQLVDVSERFEKLTTMRRSRNATSEAEYTSAYQGLIALQKAVECAQGHYLAKHPSVGSIHSRETAVAGACNRIWLYEHKQQPGREIPAGGTGPFASFLVAVFEEVGFSLKQARTAQRRFIDLGGIDAMGIYIEPSE